jgi:spore germination protein KB
MMEENNNKISAFQFAAIGFFLTTALFVGVGITITLSTTKQDSWIVSIMSSIISIIPILILIYVFNYQPKKNIFEKTKILFGNIFGNVINFVLLTYTFVILVIVITSTTSFATTMYLTKTPGIYISGVFVAIAIYAVIKGIETIGRLSEILFFLAVIIITIIIFSLMSSFSFYELKPILVKGVGPALNYSLIYASYCLTPLFFLTTIPKNDIVKNKHCYKYLVGGIFLALLNMFFVFFLTPGVISAKIAEIYRFPAYYVLRKINIGGGFNNVENFLSSHWFFHTFIMISMGFYFVKTYIKNTFKIKKDKYIHGIVIALGFTAIQLPKYIFKNPFSLTEFMKNNFSLFISLGIFVIFALTSIFIFFKKRRFKKII